MLSKDFARMSPLPTIPPVHPSLFLSLHSHLDEVSQSALMLRVSSQVGFINASEPNPNVIPRARAAGAPSACTMSTCGQRSWLLLLLLLSAAAVLPTSGDCPKSCVCNGPSEVHCTFRYLSAIPDHIRPAVERVNLG